MSRNGRNGSTQAPTSSRSTGKVISWNDRKGYGFIRPDAGGKDVFVHFSAIQTEKKGRKSLAVGATVEYELVQDPKGPRAEQVTVG